MKCSHLSLDACGVGLACVVRRKSIHGYLNISEDQAPWYLFCSIRLLTTHSMWYQAPWYNMGDCVYTNQPEAYTPSVLNYPAF
jgi:hypothetical protein